MPRKIVNPTESPLEIEASGEMPVVEFDGKNYRLVSSKATNKMLRALDHKQVTYVLDELIGSEAADAFIDEYEDPEDLTDFIRNALAVLGGKA